MIQIPQPQTTQGDKDPRCPQCGRAVIGLFIQGLEGKYHPACTQPPIDLSPHPSPYIPYIPYNPWMPVRPWWEGTHVMWNNDRYCHAQN